MLARQKTTRSAAQRQHDRAREVPGLTGVLRMLQTGWEVQTWPTVESREVSISIVSFAKPWPIVYCYLQYDTRKLTRMVER